MTKEKVAIIDLDFILHACASVGEERYVEVTHNESGRMREFKNKTEFYGRNTQGGWLSELNKKRQEKELEPFGPESFTIIQKQRVTEPLPNVLHSAKMMVEGALKASGATSYEAYLGYGDGHRVDMAKMMKYKGNREGMLRPLLLDEVKEYLQKKFKAVKVTGIEADDATVMRCVELLHQGKDAFVITVDKDAMGCPIQVYNPNRPDEGIVDCRGFGELYIDDKGKVRGKGRLFKYFQVCSSDKTDNYAANSQSIVKLLWGEKSAYKSLVGCKNDKEALAAIESIFKKLYPEPVTFTSWKNEEVTMGWEDCLNELFLMAHMKEYENDNRNIFEYIRGYCGTES